MGGGGGGGGGGGMGGDGRGGGGGGWGEMKGGGGGGGGWKERGGEVSYLCHHSKYWHGAMQSYPNSKWDGYTHTAQLSSWLHHSPPGCYQLSLIQLEKSSHGSAECQTPI